MLYQINKEDGFLDESSVLDLCEKAFSESIQDKQKILVIIPDHTRSGPIDMMFRVVYQLLADRVQTLDFLVALGTHPPMSQEAIYQRVGISRDEHQQRYPKARFFNHCWNDPATLKTIGRFSREEVGELSNGLLQREVGISINKIVFDYNLLMIVGPTFPHEILGFSGGNKYFFPGISGPEFLNLFHWLGALITNVGVIGKRDTTVRRMVDRAADFLAVERMCLSLVVKENRLVGLYAGTPEEAFSAAADHSGKIHIQYRDRPYQRVLSCSPPMYDELWTAGKCMYKLEPVVADGGELIIYAPHITEISVTHGTLIEQVGYHVRDYFIKQMDQFTDIPLGILAHSTHLKGMGTYEGGVEKPRIKVTLATQLSETLCRKVNLGYRDPASIQFEEWRGREDKGILYVEKAGEILYRLKEET